MNQDTFSGRYTVNGITPRLFDVMNLAVDRPYQALVRYSEAPDGKVVDLLGQVLHHWQRIGDTRKGTLGSLVRHYDSLTRDPSIPVLQRAALQVANIAEVYRFQRKAIDYARAAYDENPKPDNKTALNRSVQRAFQTVSLGTPGSVPDRDIGAWVETCMGILTPEQIRGIMLEMSWFVKTLGAEGKKIVRERPDVSFYDSPTPFEEKVITLANYTLSLRHLRPGSTIAVSKVSAPETAAQTFP